MNCVLTLMSMLYHPNLGTPGELKQQFDLVRCAFVVLKVLLLAGLANVSVTFTHIRT